jgi:hypothetical protein
MTQVRFNYLDRLLVHKTICYYLALITTEYIFTATTSSFSFTKLPLSNVQKISYLCYFVTV